LPNTENGHLVLQRVCIAHTSQLLLCSYGGCGFFLLGISCKLLLFVPARVARSCAPRIPKLGMRRRDEPTAAVADEEAAGEEASPPSPNDAHKRGWQGV